MPNYVNDEKYNRLEGYSKEEIDSLLVSLKSTISSLQSTVSSLNSSISSLDSRIDSLESSSGTSWTESDIKSLIRSTAWVPGDSVTGAVAN